MQAGSIEDCHVVLRFLCSLKFEENCFVIGLQMAESFGFWVWGCFFCQSKVLFAEINSRLFNLKHEVWLFETVKEGLQVNFLTRLSH